MSTSSNPLLAPLGLLEKFGANTLYIIAGIGIFIIAFAFIKLDIQSTRTVHYMFISAPIWLPVITFYLFYEYWFYYVRKEYDLSFGRTTIEIKVPQEVFKSPEAMELVLVQLYQTASPDNHIQSWIDGKHPPTTSLEIVSRGGDVRFYINIPKKRFKDLCEVSLYAHYPGIEVRELDIDYTAEVPWDPARFVYFMFHMGLKKADAYPIKTYIEYGLDKLPKEEEKIDPINSVLEVLGSINTEEHAWIQILIESNNERTFKEGYISTVPDWKKEARAEILKIITEANKRVGVKADPEKGMTLNMMNLSDGEKETIKAIERSLGKLAFNTIIRCVYVCPATKVRIGDIIPRMITMWRTYEDVNRNSIGFKWRTDVDWPWWQDPHGHHVKHMKYNELDEYKRRVLTPQSTGYTTGVMTTEELATIFHLPGKVATTPSLARIPSKRAEAPANLPIGTL